MSKVLLTIQYQIKEDSQNEVYSTLKRIRDHFENNDGLQYSFYKTKNKNNQIIENFLFENEDSYKKFNESDDEIYDGFANILNEYIVGNSKYTVFESVD